MAIRPLLALALLLATGLAGCADSGQAEEGHLRLGYFPNMTHAQALYGLQTGLYGRVLGEEGITLEAVDFNAGNLAIEALLTGSIDITYVGPSPTVNGIIAAGDDRFRIIAGAASGGARFIVQPGLEDTDDFAGKKLATPALANTQDIALKSYLAEHGQKPKDQGGDVTVINAANSDILTLFIAGQIDGAWVPEPWATRLEDESDGVERLDERDRWDGGEFVTTHVVTTTRFLEDHPATVAAFLAAHVQATAAVAAGGTEVLAAVNAKIEADTGKPLGTGLLAKAYGEVTFTNDPLVATFVEGAEHAHDLGLTRADIPPAATVYDLEALNAVLADAGQEPFEDP
jgi:NitT/TauT family transport system substrate-binding protein